MPPYPPDVSRNAWKPAKITNYTVACGHWRPFVNLPIPARLASVSAYAHYYVFALSVVALLATRYHQRTSLASEHSSVADRINRKGYLILPDGTAAQVRH